jgi:hypothetical protein
MCCPCFFLVYPCCSFIPCFSVLDFAVHPYLRFSILFMFIACLCLRLRFRIHYLNSRVSLLLIGWLAGLVFICFSVCFLNCRCVGCFSVCFADMCFLFRNVACFGLLLLVVACFCACVCLLSLIFACCFATVGALGTSRNTASPSQVSQIQ